MSSPAAKKARRESGVGATGPDTVVVLDYGSQSQLITRRVRELGVYSVLLPGDADMVRLDSRVVVVYTDPCREYRRE